MKYAELIATTTMIAAAIHALANDAVTPSGRS
jgi:hypothetical protein